MYGITIRANGDGYSVTVTPGCHGNNEGMFLGSLLTETRRCFAEAEKNLVKASKEYPIHGK
ncbi:hypothetical protein DPMN_090246 [Dreissena polymorpha]|uniref:Uncharacterized protein n=1 Tax=Dreissena polymorpha TaxID=45954 RepID=A0A9D4KXT3_DREPO|nr:hypothetical protein DPMN_090246 [Dreissena polymorpha]